MQVCFTLLYTRSEDRQCRYVLPFCIPGVRTGSAGRCHIQAVLLTAVNLKKIAELSNSVALFCEQRINFPIGKPSSSVGQQCLLLRKLSTGFCFWWNVFHFCCCFSPLPKAKMKRRKERKCYETVSIPEVRCSIL